MNSPIEEIKKAVAENRTGDALSRLLELTQSNKQLHDAIHIVLAEFNDLTSQRLKGTIDNSEATRRLNVIHDKILVALGAFDSQGKVLPGRRKLTATNVLGKLTLLFCGLCIVLPLAEYFWVEILGRSRWMGWYLAPLFLGFWTFIAYLLAMVVSASKK